jgi:hypothetical protein
LSQIHNAAPNAIANSSFLSLSLSRARALSFFLGSPERSLTYTFSRGSMKFDTGYEAGIISDELSLD